MNKISNNQVKKHITKKIKIAVIIKANKIHKNSNILHHLLRAFNHMKQLNYLNFNIIQSSLQPKDKAEIEKRLRHLNGIEVLNAEFQNTFVGFSESLSFILNPLKNLPNFKSLTLKTKQTGLPFDYLRFKEFCETLKKLQTRNLQTINLTFNEPFSKVTDLCLKLLGDTLSEFKLLRTLELDISGNTNDFTDQGISYILKKLIDLPLNTLKLTFYHHDLEIYDDSIMQFCKSLRHLKCLKILKLRLFRNSSRSTDLNLIKLSETILNIPELRDVQLLFEGDHSITNMGFDKYLVLLHQLNNLQVLKMIIPNTVYLTDQEFNILAKIFQTAHDLRKFYVVVHHAYLLTTEGFSKFAKDVEYASHLEKFSITTLFGEYWFHNEHLKYLIQSFNKIKSLRSIALQYYSKSGRFDDDCFEILSQINFANIEKVQFETRLGNEGSISDKGIIAIANALRKSTVLKKVSFKFHYCRIDLSDLSFYALGRMIKQHPELLKLRLDLKLHSFQRKKNGLEMMVKNIAHLKKLEDLTWSILLEDKADSYLRMITTKLKSLKMPGMSIKEISLIDPNLIG